MTDEEWIKELGKIGRGQIIDHQKECVHFVIIMIIWKGRKEFILSKNYDLIPHIYYLKLGKN